jgi:hypothetical protein
MAARIDMIVISKLAATDPIVNEGIVVYPLGFFSNLEEHPAMF